MDNAFAPLNSVVAVLGALIVGVMLAKRARWIRWLVSFVAAVAIAGGLGFGESLLSNYEKAHNPVAASAAIEQAMLRLSPLVAIAKENNPQEWQVFVSEFGRRVAAGGGTPSLADQRWAQSQLGPMIRGVWLGASAADPGTLIAVARKEIAVDELLQKEAVQMCATRGDPSWNLDDLPPASHRAIEEYMALVASAYRSGKGQQVPQITEDHGTELLRQAIYWKDSPLSEDDAEYIFGDDNTDAVRKCRVRLQFEKNIMSMPDNVPLLRWLYAQH